jgi:hypothetical protein
MPNYKIKIEYEKDVEAENEDEVFANLETDLAISNIDLLSDILEHTMVIRTCPICNRYEDEDR